MSVSLFQVGVLESGALGEGQDGFLAEPNDENVSETGREFLAARVVHVRDIEGAGVSLDVGKDADPSDRVSLGDVDISALLELQNGVDFSSKQVQLDRVALLYVGVGVPQGPSVVGHYVGHLVRADRLLDDLAQLERGFFLVNRVRHVLALDVPEHPEVLAGPLNADHVHESKRVLAITSDLAVDFDETFLVLADLDHLLVCESVLQTLAEENADWNAFPQFVGSSPGTGCVSSGKFVQHPVRRRGHALKMFLWSSCLQSGKGPYHCFD